MKANEKEADDKKTSQRRSDKCGKEWSAWIEKGSVRILLPWEAQGIQKT